MKTLVGYPEDPDDELHKLLARHRRLEDTLDRVVMASGHWHWTGQWIETAEALKETVAPCYDPTCEVSVGEIGPLRAA